VAWRTVVISNPARLKIENSQLVVTQEEEIPLPVEDIGVLFLESPEVLLSSSLLYRLAQAGVAVIVGDEKHMPCMAGLPFDSHSRLSGCQKLQLSMSAPFNKRCWQAVVRQKVLNQAECERIAGRENSRKVRDLASEIASGDPANIEGRAARYHFNSLFGPEFIRGDGDIVNSALDYGYAVMRAGIARALSLHGFLLSQGIHHRSELNSFNLADDFIEPFRPLVDLCVFKRIPKEGELLREHRQKLVSLLGCDISIDGSRQIVTNAMDMMTASFLTACRLKNPASLKLPEILPIREHSYE
jgi:CRISPR-associated protein Cas1